MNKIFVILILVLGSCKATHENIMFDQKLDMCYNAKLEQRVKLLSVPKDQQFEYKNALMGFENGLLQIGLLENVDKASYLKLTHTLISKNQIKNNELKFVKGDRLEREFVDSIYQDLGCYSALVELYKLVDKNDFRYKIYNIGGHLQSDPNNTDLLISLIELIPESEFQKIEYRRIVLRSIYVLINK
ncbi:hypothetical protein [Sediminicola luteus]|uniref:Uncharacterized protein n=1 Tax=Sediminicola luteus TaxID=319238 RepID=A0ABV2TZT6_9FLAO